MSEDLNTTMNFLANADLDALQDAIDALRDFQEASGGLAPALEAASETADDANESLGETGEVAEEAGNRMEGGILAKLRDLTIVGKNAIEGLGGIVNAVQGFIGSTAEAGQAIADMSAMTGLSTEKAAELTGAFGLLGMSADQVSSFVSQFSENMYRAASSTNEAGEGTGPFNEALDALGVNLLDTNGKLRGFDSVMPEVLAKLREMPPGMERTGIGTKLLGSNFETLLPLLEDGGVTFEELVAKAQAAGSILGTDVVAASDELEMSQFELQARLQGVKNDINTAIIPALLTLVQNIQPFIGIVRDQVLPALFDLLSRREVLIALGAVIAAVFISWAVSAASAAAATIAAAAPVLLILAAIGAAAYALYQAWNSNFLGIRDVVMGAIGSVVAWWQSIQPQAEAAWNAIYNTVMTVATAIAAFIQQNMDTIRAILEGAWLMIQGIIQIAWSIISGIIEFALAVLSGDWDAAWQSLVTMVQGVWEGLKTYVDGAWQSLKEILDLGWAAIGGAVTQTWDNIKTWITGAWDGIMEFFNGLPATLAGVGTSIINGLLDGLKGAWDSVVTWVNENIAALGDSVKALLGISSPSAVFADIGANVALGMATGMQSVPIPLPLPGQASGGGNGNTSMTYSPTISVPVSVQNAVTAPNAQLVEQVLAAVRSELIRALAWQGA